MKTFIGDEINCELDDLSIFEKTSRDESRSVTFWIPVESKEKYNNLQKRSKGQFAKKLRNIIIKSIDFVDKKSA